MNNVIFKGVSNIYDIYYEYNCIDITVKLTTLKHNDSKLYNMSFMIIDECNRCAILDKVFTLDTSDYKLSIMYNTILYGELILYNTTTDKFQILQLDDINKKILTSYLDTHFPMYLI
jgi:hypothetical protein